MSFLTVAKIIDQVGYLVMNETGAIISSAGYLENNEKAAEAIFNLLTITDKLDGVLNEREGLTRISVIFNNFCYVITMSNRKILVAMRNFLAHETKPVSPVSAPMTPSPPPLLEPSLSDLQVPNDNSINA